MARLRIVAGLSLAMFLVCLVSAPCAFVSGQVFATFTITPNPPIAGQSFTITETSTTNARAFYLFSGFGCNNLAVTHVLSGYTYLGQTGGVLPVTLTVSGVPAGQYSMYESNTGGNCNADFTVDPAPPAPSSYVPPVTIGGTMLPINRYLILLPWLTLVVVLTTVAAYMLTSSRKTKRQ